MITLKENVDALVLMMQKEVAFKLVKSTSLKDKSPLTLMMDYKGKKEYIMDVAERYSAPGLGKDIGANLNQNHSFYKGLYFSEGGYLWCRSLDRGDAL